MEAEINILIDVSVRITKAHTNFKKSPKDRVTLTYVETRLENLESLWQRFSNGHDCLFRSYTTAEIENSVYGKEGVYDITDENYMDYKCELKDALNNLKPNPYSLNHPIPIYKPSKTNHVQLPKITIPVFSGIYTEWMSFRDLFVSLIHDNDELDDVQKLHYLKGHLKGEAEQLLRHIPITNDSYEQCWTLLKGRYNNKQYLVNCILQRFFGQRSISSESSSAIKQLLDVSTETLNALKGLGIDTGSWDVMIIYIVSQRLDSESRKQWESKVSELVSRSDKLPTFTQFQEFLETKYHSLEFLDSKPNIPFVQKQRNFIQAHSSQNSKPNPINMFHVAQTQTCVYCKQYHHIRSCKEFINIDLDSKRNFVQSHGLCFNCLGNNHSVKHCKNTTSCQICNRRHHSLLHSKGEAQVTVSNHSLDNQVTPAVDSVKAPNKSSQEERPSTSNNITSHFVKGVAHQVLLATAVVKAESQNGGDHQLLRALLDQGSQASFITKAAVQLLGLKTTPTKGFISGLGGEQDLVVRSMVDIVISSRLDPGCVMHVSAYVLDKLTAYLPASAVSITSWPELELVSLADPEYHTPNKIDILLGAEVYSRIIDHGVIKYPSGSLVAQNTTLGWILSGQVKQDTPINKFITMHTQVEPVEELLKSFWEIEAEPFNKQKIQSVEEQRCEDIFQATTTRDEDGRYVVKLPFRESEPACADGHSRDIALKRFQYLERKFQRDERLKQEYKKVFDEYLELNHMVEVRDNKAKSLYIPYHAVIREDRQTTKFRVVFDASCKGTNGVSLNDDLMVGPTLQPELRHIIMRWRTYPICFIADIVKMYRQIKVSDEDSEYQRILWRETPEEDIKEYKMLRVTFGTSSAPYLAVKSLIQVAKDEGKDFPLAAERVKHEFYMDDLMSGCESDEEAIEIYKQMNEMLIRGGFELQKWSSNSEAMLNQIQQGNLDKQSDKKIEVKLDAINKILGLTWSRSSDEFVYAVLLPAMTAPVTKRKVISDISKLYDPQGWIAPSIIKAKIFIQKLWLAGISWDEELSQQLLEEWVKYREGLSDLTQFRLKRWTHIRSDAKLIELHGFSDASNSAYAAVVYVRVIDAKENVHVSLLTAKTRVAPIKQISLPRLELSGAVLLAKLLIEVSEVLGVPKSNIHAWTDSEIVLAWLSSHPSRWKTFIGNRCSEILTVTDRNKWAHVKSEHNPADCASRGIPASELIGFKLWLKGPSWLSEDIIHYPDVKGISTDLEERQIKTYLATSVDDNINGEEVWSKFSSLTKLLRVVAYCRRVLKTEKPKHKYLLKKEIEDALIVMIKMCQAQAFLEELKDIKQGNSVNKRSVLISLSPQLDEFGILRVGGRLHNADISENQKHPIILPKQSLLTTLIIRNAHKCTLHGAPQLMMNFIRDKYYIIGLKSLVKCHCRKCITCIRYAAANKPQLMGQLPSPRVTMSRAFLRSGVDYAGPINIRVSKGRGNRSYKGYICLFVCMATRGIHLEAVSDLTSQGFLAAFRRFVSRRGHCSELYSDNGTNFVGAARELRDLFDEEKSRFLPEIADWLATNGTQWHFIPPQTPNFGGLWEAGVRSCKFHLKRVIGSSTLTFEEITTVLTQIEACLNSRPMSYIQDQGDPMPLTPGHFLVGEPLLTVPDNNYEHSSISSLRRWQLCQRMLQDFWRRWAQEYLNHFMQRHKWTQVVPEPNIGDVVLVKELDLPPSRWLLGRIVEKHPGVDNVTRVVTLRYKNSIIKRPVSKLCVLPLADHITQTASWLPPVESWPSSRDGSRSSQDPEEEDLPYGWEQALDIRGKPYYINHVNKTTTYVAPEGCSCESPPAPRDVTLERHPELGFGFVAGSERPVLVRFVTDNSPSVGKLEPGDQILCVNGEDVSTAAREHVIAAVRACAERVTLRVCQPARAGNPARRSALLSAAKRARLRARPPRVRFADSVQLNGAPMYPPSAFSLGDLCLPPMANVLKVFLENGQTKSFKYDTTTTVADVVTSLKDKLCIVAEEHFSLVVEHVKSVRRNKLTLLDPKESLARIASRPGSHKMRCLFRVVFMPTAAAALAQRDLAALDYLYMQCCNDVAQERFSPELQPDVALRLAALHMHQLALANNLAPAKLTVKAVEREFGLERFVPSGLLESMKRKEIRRLIGHFLKLNSQMTGSQRQLTQLQAKLHYLDIVAGLPSYGAKCFGSARPERVLLVSPRFGLSQIVSRANPGPQSIASLEEVEGVRVKREAAGSADVAIFLTKDRVVALLMDERDALEMPLVIAGYYRLATGKELNVELEREPITEDIAPPYLSQHNVVPMKWSYLHYDDPIVLTRKHFAIFTMPPPYHSTPDQAKASLDTNMNSSLTNKNHSNNSSPLTGYDSKHGLLGHDVHFEKCKRNEDFRLFDPNDACYLDDGMGFDLQSVLSMELLENASNNPRLVEAKNEEVLRRVAEMQKLVENSEQYVTENCDVYHEDAFSNGMLRDEIVGEETNVDQLESDTESNNSRMSAVDDAPGILKHSDSLLLLTETINQGLSGLSIPEAEKDINLTTRQSQGLSAILNNCGLTDALLALNNDLSHSESDNDSLYTPTNSPIRRHQKHVNKVVRTSFGLHSPDATLDNKEPNLKEYLKQLREKSSKEEAKADFPYFEETSVDNDAELIDLTLIPPPQTPDELDCATQVPQIYPVVPPSFADEKKNSAESLSGPKRGDIEEFIANVTVQPPTVRVTPAIELTPEEIMSYIIPPPPGSNSSTLDREPVSYVNHSQIMEAKQQQNHKDGKPNGEVVKGTLSVSEIRNMFTAKTLSDARNSLLLKEKSKAQAQSKSDSPKAKRKSVTEKPANGTAHVIEYPTVERKGMFSCCSKDKNKSDDSDESDRVAHVEKSDSMPDVCEIRPPPRRKNVEHIQPPERPPKTAPAPAPRPRSNSFTCPNNELSAVEIPTNHFSTLNNRRLNYKVVCEINDQMQPPLPPRLEPKVLAPPPPLLLPPKKPPLPPVPSIEVLRMKTSQKQSPLREQRLASIGSPHFQRNLNSYRNLENESRLDDDTQSLRSTPNYSSMTLQSRHVRSSSETKNTILKHNEMSAVLSLCSPQMNRRFSNRPDLLNGAAGNDQKAFSPPVDRKFSASPTPKAQNHVRFKDDVVDDIPTPPSPPLVFPGANGATGAEALLLAGEAAAAALLARLHAAAQRAQHQHAHGGGEDIDENKFQRARSELTSCAVTLVGTSRTLVGALGGSGPVGPALADCLAPLRRLADLAQALGRHTSSPLQTRNLILRVHDVTAAFKDLAGAEMAQIIRDHNAKRTQGQGRDNNSTLEGQLALRAECLANVLATLLRSLRVFSP